MICDYWSYGGLFVGPLDLIFEIFRIFALSKPHFGYCSVVWMTATKLLAVNLKIYKIVLR